MARQKRKKLYIPITRSGSSILASIMTQLLDERRKARREKVNQDLESKRIGFLYAFWLLHPYLCTWVAITLGIVVYLLVLGWDWIF